MRPVALVFALLCGLAGTTAQAMAQVVGIVGDRYESYAARFVCAKANCNFSFPLFVLPNNAAGTLLIEDVSCMSLSDTLAYAAFFGPTVAAGGELGNKKAALHYANAPYNALSDTYAASYHAETSMMMVQNRYPTLNFFFNPKQGTTVIDSFTWCTLSGRILP